MKIQKNKIFIIIIAIVLSSCAISPGMDLGFSNKNGDKFVTIDKENQIHVEVEDIDFNLIKEIGFQKEPYKIGIGDKISVTVWGLPEIFPIVSVGPQQNLRIVNTDGSIFFPFVGTLQAVGKTQVQLRNELTEKLSKNFNDPQLDVSISYFESQKVYLLGEVQRPQKLSITETPLSLADAIGLVNGLNNNTSDASEVFVIRQGTESDLPRIFRANLSSPASFLVVNQFILAPQDIVYVNANGTTQWNRVISQFFPFSTFLNSVDNLVNSD